MSAMSVPSDTWEWDALPPWMTLSQAWAEQVAEMNPLVKLFPFNYAEMSQALLTVKALYELARIGGRYALVTMCIGGGQGIAAIYERL